jgi:hypothetical protein
VVVALPGIYPADEFPGNYSVQACDNVRAFLDDVCVTDSVTVALPSPTSDSTTNSPTAAPALSIADSDNSTASSGEATCLIALLANNVDGNTVLNYAEFLHWILDLSAGCLSVDDVAQQVHYGTFRDLACLCNNYNASTAPSAPQCLSCSDSLNNIDDPTRNTNTSGIALPGFYPPDYAAAVCRQATLLVKELCPTANNATDAALVPTSMPTSSPVLDIVNAPAPLTSTTDDSEEEDSGDKTSTEKLILGLVIPLATLVVLVAAYGVRQQQQKEQGRGGRSFQNLDNNNHDERAVDEEVGATKSWKKPIKDDVSITENTTEDRTLPLSPDSSQLHQQPSASQTFDAQGAQLDLLVLPSDVKQQWDELDQAAPFTSSTMRLMPAEGEPPLRDDTAIGDRLDLVAAQDSTSAVHARGNSDKKEEEADAVGGIVATSVASSSSMKKAAAPGRFSRRSNNKASPEPNEFDDPYAGPATVTASSLLLSNADARTNPLPAEEERFNPIFKLFSMGSTSSLQQQLDVMDNEANVREALSVLSVGDSSGGGGGGGGVSMIFTDDPEEDTTPNTSLIANPPQEDDPVAHTTTASSTWSAPEPNESMGGPPGSPTHPDSSDNDEFLL